MTLSIFLALSVVVVAFVAAGAFNLCFALVLRSAFDKRLYQGASNA